MAGVELLLTAPSRSPSKSSARRPPLTAASCAERCTAQLDPHKARERAPLSGNRELRRPARRGGCALTHHIDL